MSVSVAVIDIRYLESCDDGWWNCASMGVGFGNYEIG